MTLNIHNNIKERLENLLKTKKIPNIIFHGASGNGKRTLVDYFINKIYNEDKLAIKEYVLTVNCAQGKGIKFIREELKFFARTNMKADYLFKTVIMTNAEKLTIDAQSALRRCIEIYCHTTRFFIIVEEKYRLLNPILSRFCEIHIPRPILNGVPINLHKYHLEKTFPTITKNHTSRLIAMKKIIESLTNYSNSNIINLVNKLYEKAYNGLDVIEYIKTQDIIGEKFKYKLLLTINKIKGDFCNEKLLMLFIFSLLFLRSDEDLENILFM